MGNVLRLFLLVLAFFSASASADDQYLWVTKVDGVYASNPVDACTIWNNAFHGGYTVQATRYSDTVYECDAYNSTGGLADVWWTGRVPNPCTSGAQFNTATGRCDSPTSPTLNDGDICPDQTGAIAGYPMVFDSSAGKCVNLTDAKGKAYCKGSFNNASSSGGVKSSTYTVPGVLDRAGTLVAPPTFAQQGTDCQMATIGESDCRIKFSGSTVCNVTATLTGELNSSGNLSTKDAVCGNGRPCADVAPTMEHQKTPCSLSGPSSSQGCTSLDQTVTDGTQNCQSGTVGGVFACITKPPTSNGLKIDTTVSSTTNVDGSADVVKTDNATKTTCTDIGVCTSQTSTTTTTTHTSATGGTNTTTTCKGVCSSDGTGLTPGKGGAGNGDGSGGGQASASDDCSKPVICSGDIFQCAILNQQYLDMCTLRKLPTDTEKQQLADSITAENADIAANQKQLDDTASSVFNTFKSAASGSGGSSAQCLPDYPFTVMGRSITMKFSAACDYLSAIRYAILCIAYLIASRIISKEL